MAADTTETQPNNGRWGPLGVMFRALGSRNFRLFFAGQSISLIGTWMTRVATSWLVYRLTDSALLLGVVGFASQIPAFFLAPVAGVLADRWNQHRLIAAMQVLGTLQSLALAVLTLTHTITITHVILLSLLQGLVNAFEMPARQSFLIRMVDRKEDLSNAIALNSSMFNGARLVGPSLAGLLIAVSNEGVCFLVDAVSYVAVIVALLALRVPPQAASSPGSRLLHELHDGWKYVAGFPPIGYVLLLLAVMSLAGMPYLVLMPVICRDILHGGPNSFGILMGVSGLGAVMAGLYMASRQSVLGLVRLIPVGGAAFGLAVVAIGLSRSMALSIALMAFLGAANIVQVASSNTVLQTIVDDEKRGRVMSYYTAALIGTAPFGSLLAGAVAHWIGTPQTLIVGGLCSVAGAAWFTRQLPSLRAQIRPIYRRLGILPEIASGLDAATQAITPSTK
jgi:MFS family permease